MQANNIAEYLVKANIRPSHARIKILEYLMSTKSHPTVLDIYNHLTPTLSTLSKMTVYNTLNIFVEQGIIRELSIDGYETRYDADLDGVCHLLCEQCGSVVDVEIDESMFNDLVQKTGFTINNTQVNLKGICMMCQSKKNKEEENEI